MIASHPGTARRIRPLQLTKIPKADFTSRCHLGAGRKTSFAFARPSPHQRDTHPHAVSSLPSLSYWS